MEPTVTLLRTSLLRSLWRSGARTCVVLLLFPIQAEADLIRVPFTVNITHVHELHTGVLGVRLMPGDVLRGSFSLDPLTPNTDEHPNQGNYRSPGHVELVVPSRLRLGDLDYQIVVLNTPLEDVFGVSATTVLRNTPSYASVGLSFLDPSAKVLSSTSLSETLAKLGEFSREHSVFAFSVNPNGEENGNILQWEERF